MQVAAVPGFLEYRLDFGKEAEMPRSERERISKPPMRKFELRAHIYQARHAPPRSPRISPDLTPDLPARSHRLISPPDLRLISA